MADVVLQKWTGSTLDHHDAAIDKSGITAGEPQPDRGSPRDGPHSCPRLRRPSERGPGSWWPERADPVGRGTSIEINQGADCARFD
jgi:hypothetical protein